jgi:hypothetical protein
MKDFDDDETFYEEDESAEKVVAAFDNGPKGFTASPYEVIEPSPTFGGHATIVRDAFTPVLAVFSGNTVQAGLTPVS